MGSNRYPTINWEKVEMRITETVKANATARGGHDSLTNVYHSIVRKGKSTRASRSGVIVRQVFIPRIVCRDNGDNLSILGGATQAFCPNIRVQVKARFADVR